ncbi:hypothetical protein MBLNU459_g6845t3 [Dothideomycetes sp. NU459]
MGDANTQTRRNPSFLNRAVSPVESSFSVSRILPSNLSKPVFNAASFGAPPELPMSSAHSSVVSREPSVFDAADDDNLEHYDTEPTTAPTSRIDEHAEYDLKPPPPSVSHNNAETLAERFFSKDHLNLILRDASLSARFTKFVSQYRPQSVASLNSYVETQKAIVAIEYANAIAQRIQQQPGTAPLTAAATVDERFDDHTQTAVENLVDDALPAYITHRLVHLVTDTLVKEITGNSAPLMREMIPSLAEVYCVTDPSNPDNPIVYASEEFYNTTQYGREYVIGRNCRFLQGPKSSGSTVKRMIEALAAGQEITETILN